MISFGSKLKNKKIIFSDIFDTILHRFVYPEYIKKIWCKEINAMFDFEVSSADLYKKRFDYEAYLCQENRENGYDLEFRYSDLIKMVYNAYRVDLSFDDFLAICKDTEVKIEIRNSYLNRNTYNEFRNMKNNGYSLYLISDMYLEADMIAAILKGIGFDVEYDGLFVSSTYLLTKRTGKLYSKVLEFLNVESKEILMIGDNQYSDYDEALNKGLDAFLVDSTVPKLLYKEYQHKTEIIDYAGEICKIFNKNKGFENIIGSLYLFIEKLYQQLIRDEINDVFFLAREGEFLIRLFREYQKNIGDKKINAHYFMASRKSTFLPSLKKLDEEEFFNLFRQYINISIFEFLTSINFTEEEINQLRFSLSFNIENRINNLPKSEEFNELLNNKLFMRIYEKNREEQNKNFKDYINQFSVNIDNGLNFVDVGWKGTIQDNIFNIYNHEVKIKGYYLGLVATGNMNEDNSKNGILFNQINNTENSVIYNENRALFEMLLDASHGSATRYLNDNGLIEVSLQEDVSEITLFKDKIKPIQDKMFMDFQGLCKLLLNSDYDQKKIVKIVNGYHATMVFKPNKYQLEFFENIHHLENFGICEVSSFEVNKDRTFTNKIREYRKLISNPINYLGSSFWILYTFYQNDLILARIIYGRIKWINAKRLKLF